MSGREALEFVGGLFPCAATFLFGWLFTVLVVLRRDGHWAHNRGAVGVFAVSTVFGSILAAIVLKGGLDATACVIIAAMYCLVACAAYWLSAKPARQAKCRNGSESQQRSSGHLPDAPV